MTKPKLYLFVGYPGSGKTTVAKAIEEVTGAVHLWADNERWKMFDRPTHHPNESKRLYDSLNAATAKHLRNGHSVIFDTNFNHRTDRDYLRSIAEQAGAETVLIWLTTDIAVAHDRAVHGKVTRNGYEFNMTHEMFQAITAKLEAPTEYEQAIKIDGAELDIPALKRQFESWWEI